MIMPNWWYIWAAAGHDPLGVLGEPKTLWDSPNLDENESDQDNGIEEHESTDQEKAQERKDDIKFVLKLVGICVVSTGLAVTTMLLCNRYYYKQRHKKSRQTLEMRTQNMPKPNNNVIDWYAARNNLKRFTGIPVGLTL